MILRRCRLAPSVVVLCAAIWAGTGCRDKQPPAAPAAAATTRVAPEAGFDEIVRLIKSGIELKASGPPSGISIQSDRASSRLQITNVVTSQLIKPTDSTTPYRGIITVTSTSTYSLRKSADDADDQKKQDASPDDKRYLDNPDDEGFDSLDNQLVTDAPADDSSGTDTIESVQRRTDTDVRNYELAYHDGHWALMTKLDPETEKSVDNAFKRP